MAVDIRLLGDKEIVRKLKRLADAVQNRVVKLASKKAIKPMLARVKSLTPVDTGRLRDSLKAVANKPSRGFVGYRVQPGNRKELGIDPQDKAFYPVVVEFGTDKVPAKSYLRAGFKSTESTSRKILLEEIGKGIERALKK